MRCTGCGKLTVADDVARFHWAACVMRLTAHRDGPPNLGASRTKGAKSHDFNVAETERNVRRVPLHALCLATRRVSYTFNAIWRF